MQIPVLVQKKKIKLDLRSNRAERKKDLDLEILFHGEV